MPLLNLLGNSNSGDSDQLGSGIVGSLLGGLPENTLIDGLVDVVEGTVDQVGGVVDGLLGGDSGNPLDDLLGGIDDEEETLLPGVIDDLLDVPDYRDTVEDTVDDLNLVETDDITQLLDDVLTGVNQILSGGGLSEQLGDLLGGEDGSPLPDGGLESITDILSSVQTLLSDLVDTVVLDGIELVRHDGLQLIDDVLGEVSTLLEQVVATLSEGGLGEGDPLEPILGIFDGLQQVGDQISQLLEAGDMLGGDSPALGDLLGGVQELLDEVLGGIEDTGLLPAELTDTVTGLTDMLLGDDGVLGLDGILLNPGNETSGTDGADNFVFSQPGDATVLDFNAAEGDRLIFDTGYGLDSVDDLIPFLSAVEVLANDVVNLDFGDYGLISLVGLATQDLSWDLVEVLS